MTHAMWNDKLHIVRDEKLWKMRRECKSNCAGAEGSADEVFNHCGDPQCGG